MTKERFHQSADRYLFDFKLCPAAKGWAQLDTRQDASYYGNWINPTERKLVSYVEGDVCITTCETDEEFVAEVESACKWHEENDDKRPGIDTLCRDEITAEFTRLGLAHWLH